MPIPRAESAAHQLLAQLEARAGALADLWQLGSFEVTNMVSGGEELVNTSLGVVPCIFARPGPHGETHKALVPAAGSVDDATLEAIALLLSNAHTLISLARIGIERAASFGHLGVQIAGAADFGGCPQCGSCNVQRATSSARPGVYRTECMSCGAAMDEIGPRPPALLAAPAHGPQTG